MYIHPQLYVAKSYISEKGIFTYVYIPKGTIIFSGIHGSYKHLTQADILDLDDITREKYMRYSVQVDDDKWSGPSDPEPDDITVYTNHSCVPNAFFVSEYTLVSLRNIYPGEELTYDYATTDTSKLINDVECHCHTDKCRGKIKSSDWMTISLPKYVFLPYIQKKLDRL